MQLVEALGTRGVDGIGLGDEIVAYSNRDPASGRISLATAGRGMLGTRPQVHHVSEPVTLLEHRPVSMLAAGLSATDSMLQLVSAEDFPSEGTVLVDQELVHYTRLRDNTAYFRSQLTSKGITVREGIHPIVPIIIGDTAKAIAMSRELLQRGVYVSGFENCVSVT